MEIKRRKEWEKRSKQSRIIDIAEDLFNEYGFEATTLDLIAKEAGYSKRNLYQYFEDKNDIFNAVTHKALTNLNSELKFICNEEKLSGLDMVIGISRALFVFFLDHRNSFENIIFFDITYYNSNGKTISSEEKNTFGLEAEKLHKNNLKLILFAIERGFKDGSIISNFTPKQLQLIIWGQNIGIIHSISKRYKIFKENYECSPKEVFANYLKMIHSCLQHDISDHSHITI